MRKALLTWSPPLGLAIPVQLLEAIPYPRRRDRIMAPEADRSNDTDPTENLLSRSSTEKAVAAEPSALSALEVAQVAAQLASEKKAEDILILDLKGECGYADYFVIASAPSERQSMAVARSVDDGLRRGGLKPMHVEGMRQGNWVLIDMGDVVVHTFLSSARDYYDLEGFWADADRVAVDESAGIENLRRLGLNRFGEFLAKNAGTGEEDAS